MAQEILRNNFSSVENFQLTDSLGIQFEGRTSNPADADLSSGRLYYNSTSNEFRWYTGSTWTAIGSGGGGAGGTLDEAYQNGRTISTSLGAIVVTDSTSSTANTIELNKTGAGSGNVLDFDFTAAATGSAINIDIGSAVAAVGIIIDSEGGAHTGNGIQFTDDSTGTHNDIAIVKSGSGATTGLSYVESYNGSSASFVVKATLDNDDGLDTTVLQAVRGSGARTAPVIDINDASTSGATVHVIDIDLTGVYVGNVIDFATTAAATGNVFFANLDNGVAMTAIHVEGSGVRTQPMVEVATDATGSANMVTFVVTGAISGNVIDFQMDTTSTGNVIDIDMNASVGGKAIYLDSGAAIRTAALIDILADGSGNANMANIDESNTGSGHLFDINISGIGSGNCIDITYSAADTGDALKVVMADNVAGGALVITGAGARTDNLIEVTTSETGSVDGIMRMDITGVFTGSGMLLKSSGAATTGSLLHFDLDAGVAYKAITIDHAGAREVATILATFDGTFASGGGGTFLDANITMTGASASPFVDVDITGAYTGNLIDVLIGASLATGVMIKLDLGATATGSQAINLVSGAMARTTALVKVDEAGTNSGGIMFDLNSTGVRSAVVFDIDDTAATTGNIFDYATSAASTGTIFEINLTNAVAAKWENVTLAGTRTVNASTITDSSAGAVDTWQIDDSSTRSGHIWDVNITGVFTGNVMDIVYATAAATGDAIHVDMGTNVAGNAIQIDAAGIRTAPLINIVNTGTDGGTDDHVILISQTGLLDSDVINIAFATAASTGNALFIGMGTNVAGSAIQMTSAGTGTSGEGCILDVEHTGALAAGADAVTIHSTGSISATSNLLALEQDTGAGSAGANCLYIDAAGTNVEAIEINAGILFEATVTANGAGNGETLSTAANISFYDPNGASRTGVILTAGLRDGQRVTVCNFADAAEDITFAASGTSNVAGGTACVISQFECRTFIWHATRALWYYEIAT